GSELLSVTFSPDGRWIAEGSGRYSSNDPGRLKLWTAADGTEVHTIPAPSGGVNRVAFSPDGKRLAFRSSGVVERWDVDRYRKVRPLRGHTGWVYTVAFSPDGTLLATGGWDQTLRIWDAASGMLLRTGEGHTIINTLAFSPDGKRLASCSEDQ